MNYVRFDAVQAANVTGDYRNEQTGFGLMVK